MIPDRKVELCLATQHFFPTHGGAQLRFLRYLPGLYKRGIHTLVVTGTPKAKKAMESDFPADWLRLPTGEVLPTEEINGIPIHRVRLPDKGGLWRIIVFNRAMLQFCRQPGFRPEVVQLVSSLQPPSFFWMRRLRKLGIRMVYGYTLAAKVPANPLLRALWRWTFQRLYNQFDCIVASSKVTRDLLFDLGVKARIEVIPNGVDLKQFYPATSEAERRDLRASFGINYNQKMITTVGAVHPRKGSDLLLEAWGHLVKRFPDVHLFFVGLRKDLSYPNLGEFRRKLETLLTASGATDRVHFAGVVRNVEVYLRASDVFVFPSQREGMPNAVLEAMASGLPVILTPFTGLSEDFGKPGQEYLLAERDPKALAAQITKLLENDELRNNLGLHARNWVEKTMDVELSLDQYAALYHELANQTRAHGSSP